MTGSAHLLDMIASTRVSGHGVSYLLAQPVSMM
jgi:hypothetical protein